MNLSKLVMRAFVETVDREIDSVDAVNTQSRQWDDDGKYNIWSGTEVNGAYWALRSVIRNEPEYVDTYMRMEEYFDAKCKAIVAAFEVTNSEE